MSWGTEGIRIVPMREHHLDAFAVLERLRLSLPRSRKGLATKLLEPTACFLAAERGEETIGYAGMHCILDEAYVINVAVGLRFRRHGVGWLLMQALGRAAIRYGAAALSLEARVSSQSATHLCRSCEFAEIGLCRGIYEQPKEDGLVTTKASC